MSFKLPISHPDYRYPPALNPYAHKIIPFTDFVFSDNQAETLRHHWHKHFTKINPQAHPRSQLIVEIGCNTGHVVRALAEKDPKNNYIGIDWKFKTIYQGLEKAHAKKITNLVFLRANVERIQYMFGENEIDRLNMYFPDPWPKKPQWKKRTLNRESFRQFYKLLNKGGKFHIKTDHEGYFDWILEALQASEMPFKILEQSRDLHQEHPHPQKLEIPEVTLFEKIFIKEGIKIKSLLLEK